MPLQVVPLHGARPRQHLGSPGWGRQVGAIALVLGTWGLGPVGLLLARPAWAQTGADASQPAARGKQAQGAAKRSPTRSTTTAPPPNSNQPYAIDRSGLLPPPCPLIVPPQLPALQPIRIQPSQVAAKNRMGCLSAADAIYGPDGCPLRLCPPGSGAFPAGGSR